jgi:Gnt-I system high-affinity gluconate transporter
MPIVYLLIGILLLILLTTVVKLDAFLSFIIVAISMGIVTGMDLSTISGSIITGMGNTLGFIAIILGFGAMLGKLISDSGAAQRISITLLNKFGKKHVIWALTTAGFIVGVPLFYGVGFVLLVPLMFTIAYRVKLPVVYLGLPMITALSATHGLLPPHPAPTALVEQFNADMGTTIFYGIIICIPIILVAGPIFARTLKKIKSNPLEAFYDNRELKDDEMPGFGISVATALFPVVLMILASVTNQFIQGDSLTLDIINFIGDPTIAMVLAVVFAIYTLGIRQGKKVGDVADSLVDGVKSIAMILLIIGGAGALKQILTDSGTNDYLAMLLKDFNVSPIVLGWGMAVAIRLSIGSATVAGLTTAGIIAPLVIQTGADPNLMVLSVGAGSIFFSHVNDSGFWLFKEYFNLSIKDTIRTWSTMEAILSIAGLLAVLILDIFI